MPGSRCEVRMDNKNKRLFPTTVMCRQLNISTSGYYGSIKRQPCTQQIRRRAIGQAAAVSYFESHRIYGHRKVHEDLIEEGIFCSKETVRRVMRDIGLFSRIKSLSLNPFKGIVASDYISHSGVIRIGS